VENSRPEGGREPLPLLCARTPCSLRASRPLHPPASIRPSLVIVPPFAAARSRAGNAIDASGTSRACCIGYKQIAPVRVGRYRFSICRLIRAYSPHYALPQELFRPVVVVPRSDPASAGTPRRSTETRCASNGQRTGVNGGVDRTALRLVTVARSTPDTASRASNTHGARSARGVGGFSSTQERTLQCV